MKLLHDSHKHNQYLTSMAKKKPNRILISTFGIYAGVSKNGVDVFEAYGYECHTRDILLSMIEHSKQVDMVVGIGRYSSCKGQHRCKDCEAKYIENIIRYAYHVEKYPEVNWKYSLGSHLKAYLYYYDNAKCGLVGGRNFTNSEWDDITVTINGEAFDDISDHVNNVWNNGIEFDYDKSLYEICLKNGIQNSWVDEYIEMGLK